MGKLKGKVLASGNSGMLKYTDDAGRKIEVKYDQPFSAELGIGVGTRVSFDLVTAPDGSSMAVAILPINKGEISDINPPKGMGTITETESGIKYTFNQNFLKESGFEVGQTVTYDLVLVGGQLLATGLNLVDPK